jgi:energy-coupling factor transporter ATP-binding protein EcfA2
VGKMPACQAFSFFIENGFKERIMSVVKVFVSGRSGSGKTTAINHMTQIAGKKGCSVVQMKDYPILYEMFQADLKKDGKEKKRFKPAAYGGFEIIDYTAFDDALVLLEGQVQKQVQYYNSLGESSLIIVEFARSDYHNALRKFTPEFLRSSYFFYVEADVERCIQRIHQRVTLRSPEDKPGNYHFVPDTILRSYFNNQDDWHYMAHEFKEDFGMLKEVVAYRNTGSQEALLEEVNAFMEIIFARERLYLESTQPQLDDIQAGSKSVLLSLTA